MIRRNDDFFCCGEVAFSIESHGNLMQPVSGGSDPVGSHDGDGNRWRLDALARGGDARLALPRGAGNPLASSR